MNPAPPEHFLQSLLPLLRRGLSGLGESLRLAAEALSAHRAYLFRVEEREGVWFTSQLAEWSGPDTVPQIQNPALQNLPLREAGYGRWLADFLEDRAVAGPVASFPEEEKPFWKPKKSKAFWWCPSGWKVGCGASWE